MTILGISASGRSDGVTAHAVQHVLESSGEPYEYLSLAGLRIVGCQGCTRCASDNRCRVADDWPAIGDRMLTAEALVFGAPDYYGMINALGHACLERTFAFRHRQVFSLAGKLGVAVSSSYAHDSPVLAYIERMMRSNMMPVVGSVRVDGYSQCYTCGFGHDCSVGNVVGRHGFLESIEPQHLPPTFEQQPEAVARAYQVGRTLGSILRARR